MVYGYMLESNKPVANSSLVESFYYKLYNQIKSENYSFRRIVESLVVLEKNHILNEEDQQAKDKTLMDKIKVIFKKVCLFFKKIKNEFYEKFIKLGYNQLKKAKEKYKIADNFEEIEDKDSNEKFYSDFKAKFISKESLNQYNSYLTIYNDISTKLELAYEKSDLESANNIDYSSLPKVEIKVDEEKLSFRTNGLDNKNDDFFGIYNIAMAGLDNAKTEIEENFKIIENDQLRLSKYLSSKYINHNQLIILSKIIDLDNSALKLSYKFVNASIRSVMSCCSLLKPLSKSYNNQRSGGKI